MRGAIYGTVAVADLERVREMQALQDFIIAVTQLRKLCTQSRIVWLARPASFVGIGLGGTVAHNYYYCRYQAGRLEPASGILRQHARYAN